MPFEPRLFSGADGNSDGRLFVDPAAAESANTAAHAAALGGFSPARAVRGARARAATRVGGQLRSAEADSDADLELPDQLAMLAAQLRDEADQLAAQHAPPEVREIKPIAERGRWRRFARVAAIVLLGVGLVAWRSLAPRGGAHPNAATVAAAHSGNALASRDTPAAKAAVAAQGEQPATMRTASVLTKTSATVALAAAKNAPAAVASDPQSLRTGQGIQEVSAGEPAVARHPPANETEMLRRQVEGFDKLIHRLQAELAARDAAQIENEKLIQSLRQENEQLRHQQR
jgi:hypothetical protein